MTPAEFETILRETLDDLRLSRAEKKAIRSRLQDVALGAPERIALRHVAFEIAREFASESDPAVVIEWLDEVTKVLVPEAASDSVARASFSPGEAPRQTLTALLRGADRSADICVFTITDNVITDEILAAHARGVRVRVVTDNHKSEDLGSDIERIEAAGVPVAFDVSDNHMHHKFALFDRQLLVTGSYNWTRSAALHNQENIVLSDDVRLVGPFIDEFERLWREFGA